MMTDKHTSGPWIVTRAIFDEDRGGEVAYIIDGQMVANAADARLIAAAPLLLDALQDVVAWVPVPRQRDHPGRVVIDKARDAIRKARGEEAGS